MVSDSSNRDVSANLKIKLMRDKDVLTLDEDVVISEARAMATKVLEAIGVREPE